MPLSFSPLDWSSVDNFCRGKSRKKILRDSQRKADYILKKEKREMEAELAKKEELVEFLNQELDDKDDELAELDDALAKSRERYDAHTSYWIGVQAGVRGGKYR